MNELDEKAIRILKKYDLLNPDKTSKDDFLYAKNKNIMFDQMVVSHDDSVQKCFDIIPLCNKDHFTNLFLASLSTHRLDYRSGLSAYAIMQSFPNHIFSSTNDFSCKICGGLAEDNFDASFSNSTRFFCGGINSGVPQEVFFFISQHLKIKNMYPTDLDFLIFTEIIDTINNSEQKDTISTLHKKINKIKTFKSKSEEVEYFLATLGYCSILETVKHPGLLHKFTNLELAPRSTHNSDWAYPIDFWKGKDKINKEAFDFWFGGYPKLKSLI